MKRLLSLSILIFLTLIFLSCGGDKKEANNDNPQEATQDTAIATAEKDSTSPGSRLNQEEMFSRNPNIDPAIFEPPDINTSPEIFPGEMEEGTPESSGYWFAEYFTSGDSAMAYTLCTDSMVGVVREILQQPRQMALLKNNRQTGYTLLSASKALDSCDTDECSVCLTAQFMGETRQECNFRFRYINGEWKLCRFGK